MYDIDSALRRLAEAPPPAHLAQVDAAVFQRIEGHRFGPNNVVTTYRAGVVTLALVMGIAGGLVPGESDSRDALVPISAAAKLAPSTLLLGNG